jgi:hypothetical protein
MRDDLGNEAVVGAGDPGFSALRALILDNISRKRRDDEAYASRVY